MEATGTATTTSQLDVLKAVLETIPDKSLRDQCCFKAAKSASVKGQLDLVIYLVSEICDPNLKDQCCIEAAKSASRGEVVEFLISCISSPDQRANLRFQCAVTACSRLHEDVVASLGLEPDWLFQYSTILSFTAEMAIEGRNSVLTDTLSRMQPAHITQLLRLSISQRHVALAVTIAVTLINDERVSTEHVDLPDSTGATVLMLAADADHHELIEKLIDLGASVRVEDRQGRTALSRACEAGHVRAAKALMDRGADACHRDGRGLTCAQVAQLFEQRQVLRLLDRSGAGSPEARQAAAHRLDWGLHRFSDDSQQDRLLSEELHRLLSDAGFIQERAECQQRLADRLQGVARVLTQDGNRRQMTGSYAEGWANSLVQVNGRTDADSDIGWTVLVAGQEFHLEGGCDRHWQPLAARCTTRLQVTEGYAQVAVGAGSQPAVTAMACGVRSAQSTCHAIQCCSSFCEDRVEKLFPYSDKVHLVRATRPSSTNELRVSFSFQEKDIMRRLSTVQGQLFILIKFIFKRHLPLTLDTPGLKSYHAKTLLFFMLEKHGKDPETEAWQPHNLIALLNESLDMMLSFIDSSSSPDECMPHFFIPDAPLYFKNAGIGGDFDNTKARVRDRLCELRSDIGGVVEQLMSLLRPLQSEKFYFHPFTLLPLTAPPAVTEIREGSGYPKIHYKFADVYIVVHQCVSELQSESSDRDTLMRQLSLLHQLPWCKCAALCMTAMAHLKFGESEEAERLAMELQRHQVESGLKPQDIQREIEMITTGMLADSDWACRFCLPCDSPPRFPFLPEFTQTLFTARLSQPLSSHLYVNFRCLSWSLQAELLHNRAPAIAFDHWIEQLLGDPDLEELLTLAHYSDCREHVELSLQQMEMIKQERRVAMETQDEEKIGWVREKLKKLDPPFLKTWEKVQFLGRGGFGEVHEIVTDKNVSCAAKILKMPSQLGASSNSKSSEIEKIIAGERNLYGLQHDNIVKFLHIAQTEPATIVVFTELLKGQTLEAFINKEPLKDRTTREFCKQICSALAYIHNRKQPVIHRDINCSNIIVLEDSRKIKLIDFGLSIILKQSMSHISSSSQYPKGTLNFMAPELLGSGGSDSLQYSRQSDIWAFGCSVYQMATGARPLGHTGNIFQMALILSQSDAPPLPDCCSSELQNFYGCCTTRNRQDRKSASELMEHPYLVTMDTM
ncbi:hypothetical protein BOX15_Mlig008650g1 [Macrostomum lignano]|uniref:Protein kinase domain-containing protein n=1 Tax=Macrostomum lignano TaxID=282301 RepID=A0A267F181_9PLAT|nr:hypothetical protein BOX15_Mlig008650g1 [Macrostomum lignano]